METKKLDIPILIFRVLSLIIILICVLLLIKWNNENSKNADIIKDLNLVSKEDGSINLEDLRASELKNIDNNENSDNKNDYDDPSYNTTNENSSQKIKVLLTDFNKLTKINPDTVAWIKIDNADINYSIVKHAENNSYYLKRNFYKNNNSAGWIFADYRNNFDTLDKNTIVYGHNRRDGSMFSNLKKYLNSDFALDAENKFLNFNTINKNYIAEVFSVYKTNANALSFSNTFDSNEDFDTYLTSYIENSLYDFKTEVSSNNKILTLCTCDNNTSYRIVVHAKLIPIE